MSSGGTRYLLVFAMDVDAGRRICLVGFESDLFKTPAVKSIGRTELKARHKSFKIQTPPAKTVT
jgi:hypothetical protein